jgi:hypothetical protein
VLWGCVSLSIKVLKTYLTESSPHDAPTHHQTGANGHTMRGAEGLCGAQAIRDLRNDSYIMGLKVGEHEGY